jgi:hypothetical protein
MAARPPGGATPSPLKLVFTFLLEASSWKGSTVPVALSLRALW